MPVYSCDSKLPSPFSISDKIIKFELSEKFDPCGVEMIKIVALFEFEKSGAFYYRESYNLGSLGEAGWWQSTIKNGFLKDLAAIFKLAKMTKWQTFVLQQENVIAPYRPESIPYNIELVFDPDKSSHLPALLVNGNIYSLNHSDIMALGEWLRANV